MQLISVILPAYNASEFIAEAISSVIGQTHENWELIIIDDGSVDDTGSIVDSFLKSDNRIKYISKLNSGVSDSRNVGIKKAQGNFIAFLDADDVWLSDNLKKKLEELDSCDVIYSECELIDEHSKLINKVLTGSEQPELIDLLLLKGNYITAPSGWLIKKEVLTKIGEFDINLSNNADQDLWIRILSNGFKIKLIQDVLWKYRVHNKNMSGNISLLESDSVYMFDKFYKSAVNYSANFKRKSYSNLYLMLAGSWWKNGNNKFRGVYYIIKAFFAYPPIIFKRISRS